MAPRQAARRPVESDAGVVRSQLVRGLQILEVLAGGPRSASDLARELGVHRSTALRLLRELEANQYVLRTEAREYASVPGRVVSLMPTLSAPPDPVVRLEPMLAAIRDEFGESTNLSIPAGDRMVYVAYFPSPHPVAVWERQGAVRQMYCSAIGKAYLAALTPAQAEPVLTELRFSGGTRNAPRNRADLERQLEQTRQRGYAIDVDESLPGVSCVAVPVRLDESAIGAAGLSAPSARLPAERIHTCGARLRALIATPP
jgi:DNA-binding IclR family transcriptional regulator